MTGSRPNILVIFADQQRWDTLGCNGHPMDLTPELDRLARSGTRFVLPITNQPVCAPARATLLTGRYGTSHGVWRNNIGLAPGTQTLATRLSGAGYRTGYVGKWHLSPLNSVVVRCLPITAPVSVTGGRPRTHWSSRPSRLTP